MATGAKNKQEGLIDNRFERFFRKHRKNFVRLLIFGFGAFLAFELIGPFLFVTYYKARGLPVEIFVDNFWITRLVLADTLSADGPDGVEYVGAATRKATNKYYRVADPIRRHRLNESVGWIKSPYATDSVGWRITNPQGFASPDGKPTLLEKPEGTFRIFVLGGSTVEGDGAETPLDTLPAWLARALGEQSADAGDGRRFEVINAGVGGYKSSDEVLYFLTELWPYEPDLVISYNGWNDLHVNRQLYEKHGPQAIYFRHPKHDDMQDQLNQSFNIGGGLSLFLKGAMASFYEAAEQTATFFVIQRLQDRLSSKTAAVESEPPKARQVDLSRMYEEISGSYLRNIEIMIHLSEIYGFRYAAFLQPLMGVDDKPYSKTEQAVFESNSDQISERRRFYELLRPELAEMSIDWERSGEVCIADLSGGLRGIETRLYEDSGHLLGAGNEIMAKLIMRTLDRCGLLN